MNITGLRIDLDECDCSICQSLDAACIGECQCCEYHVVEDSYQESPEELTIGGSSYISGGRRYKRVKRPRGGKAKMKGRRRHHRGGAVGGNKWNDFVKRHLHTLKSKHPKASNAVLFKELAKMYHK